jgi:flagellar hook assembly protein FlgD
MHLPQEYSLKQNYPNPFNPSTKIKYQIAKSEYVNISIFDLNGTKISSILNQYSRAGKGSVSWNGKNEMGQNVSGGIYLYTIETPSFSKTKKMILLK